MNKEPSFIQTKIYEKLEYDPEPEGYDSNIPWLIQQQIAATNGKHYAKQIGYLKEIPDYDLPVPGGGGKCCKRRYHA